MGDGVDYPAEVLRGTAKALYCKIQVTKTSSVDMWIPKSVIHEDSEIHDETTRTGKLVLKQWWAVKEGLL
jgi:hypothetical protein